MAYDEDLADRLRGLLAEEPNLTEKKMFGGLAFLVAGHLTVAASGQGGLLVRCDPKEFEGIVASGAAQPMEMRGRPMKGWLRVEAADVDSDDALTKWVTTATTYAHSLPPKAR